MFGLNINWANFWKQLLEWGSTSGLRILAYIIGAIILIKVIRKVGRGIVERVEDENDTTRNERERRADTLFNVVNVTSKIFVWTIVVFMILREFGANLGPLLAGAGVVGVAIGFGAQSIVKDFFNGFLILLENQYRVGDVIKIADRAGLVESINLRTTVIRDLEGVVHVIPNGEIGPVDNMTFMESRAVVDVGISYNSSIDKAMEEIEKIGAEMQENEEFGRFIRSFEILGVDKLGASSVDIRVLIKTDPLQQWGIARKFKYFVKKRFDEVGIEIPFPHHTVYMRQEPNKSFRIQGEKKA